MGTTAPTRKASSPPRAAASHAAQPEPVRESPKGDLGISALWVPTFAGAAMAAYSPKAGMAVGCATLVSSVIWKKGWMWWFVGCVILIVALLSYSNKRQGSENETTQTG